MGLFHAADGENQSFEDGINRRDLFPLPHLVTSSLGDSLSQHQRRKAARTRKVVEQSNAIIDTLNSMYSPGKHVGTDVSASQQAAHNSIFRQVKDISMKIPMYREREASRELLQSCLSYAGEEASTTVRPFNRSLVSIPEVGAKAPYLFDVLDPHGREFLQDPDAHIFVSGDEWGHIVEKGGTIRPYMDEVLRHDHQQYFTFVKDLFDRGMITFTTKPRATITPFFVAKKNGKLRLVLDCRGVNQMFRPPPALAMSAGFSWSRLSVERSQTLYTAQSDIKDYFYSLRLPSFLQPFFALPPIPCHLMQQWGVSAELGGLGSYDDMVYPQFGVVPMGWSWAMFFAQRVHQNQALISSGLGMSRILAEGLPAPSLDDGEPCILAYADSLNVIGTDKDRVQKVKDDITTHLEKIGLRVHEVMDANTIVESLGFTIDGKSGRVLPIADRVAKVIAAFKWLARRPRVTGRVVEKLIGHAVHFMLLRREMLSIFRSSYDFVGASYQHRCRLWKSVAKEAEWAANLLQICSANLKRNWSTVVTASDASLSGIAVCAREATLTEIKRIGLCPESWRFRSKHAVNPRESVFHTEKLDPVDPFSNVDTVKPVTSNPSAYDDPYELNPDFKEIPIQFMHESHWGLRFAAHMQHSEAITILEARGTVAAVRHLLRDVNNFGLHFIHLNDNLANVLCSEKGRSGSYPMLRCCRRLCALVLAGDLGVHHRWVPSELNPADHGSRRWEIWRTSGREERFKKHSNTEEIMLGSSCTRTWGDLPKNSVIHGSSGTKSKHQGSHQEEIASKLEARKSIQEKSVHGGTSGRSKVLGTDTAGTGGGVDSCGIGLCQEASNISAVCPGQSTEFANRPEVRRELQRVSELLICRRARYNRRIKTFCSHAGRLPSVGTQVTTSKIKKMPAGMDKVGPRTHSSTHSFPADSFDGNHHVQESSRGTSGGYSYNVRGLPQAGRGSRDTSCRRDQAEQVIKISGGKSTSIQKGRILKSGPGRREHCHGQSRTSLFGASASQACQSKFSDKPLRIGIPHHEINMGADTNQDRASSAAMCDVPVETCRSVTRSPQQLQNFTGGETPRQVVSRFFGSEIREARADQCRVPGPSSQDPKRMHGGTKVAEECGPKFFQPPSHVTPKNMWVIEIFSGCARLSQACADAGFYVVAFDTEYNQGCNVLNHHLEAQLRIFIALFPVALVWFGLPCSSWSLARKWDGGPPPLRDDDLHLWGRPNLSTKDRKRVDTGNDLLFFTRRLIQHCLNFDVRWVVENPWTSRVWQTPQFRNLEFCTDFFKVDYCQYRMPWKKSTGLLACNFSKLVSVLKTCSPVNGRCSASNRKHVILQGTDSQGTFLTLHAQPYPIPLCHAIASCLSSVA